MAKIEHHISYLTEGCRWPDFRGQKHGSFSYINCWFNVSGVEVSIISANIWFSHVWAMNAECPERQFPPLNLAAVVNNVYIHIWCYTFTDWFLTTHSESHQWDFSGASFRILSGVGGLFFPFLLFFYFLSLSSTCLQAMLVS